MTLLGACSDSRILWATASLAAASAASSLGGPVWPGTQQNSTHFPTLGISEICHRISTETEVIVSVALKTLEGTQGNCAEVMLTRLTNIKKHSIHGIEFYCEDDNRNISDPCR
jgi:hypothetical protein